MKKYIQISNNIIHVTYQNIIDEFKIFVINVKDFNQYLNINLILYLQAILKFEYNYVCLIIRNCEAIYSYVSFLRKEYYGKYSIDKLISYLIQKYKIIYDDDEYEKKISLIISKLFLIIRIIGYTSKKLKKYKNIYYQKNTIVHLINNKYITNSLVKKINSIILSVRRKS